MGSRVCTAGPLVLAPREGITNHGARPQPEHFPQQGGGVNNLKIKATSGSATIDTSETKFTWDFGGGATFGAGPASFFAEIRYVSIQESGGSTKFVPITVGVTFGGGKSSKK